MALSLRWLLHSATSIVLGYPKDGDEKIVGCPNEQAAKKGVHGLKLSQVQRCPSAFQMPLHYPRYKKADYEKMEEWRVDMLLREYGLNFKGSLEEKRVYAMGTFLWPDQL
ncbi:hypothetical protein NMG60_11009969 [Bertholletia excelsa]